MNTRHILAFLLALAVSPAMADTPVSSLAGTALTYSGGKLNANPATGSQPGTVTLGGAGGAQPLNARGLTPLAAVDGMDNLSGLTLVGTLTGSINVSAGGGYIDGSVSPVAVLDRDQHYLPAGATSLSVCYAGWYQSPAEFALPNSVFEASNATVLTGGSGYTVGQIVPLPSAYAYVGAAVRVLAVSSGAITKVALEQGGIYYATVLADGTAAISGGATFSFTWRALGATHVRVGIEPVFGQQVTTGGSAILQAASGLGRDTTGVVSTGHAESMSGDADLFVKSGSIACTQPVRVHLPPGSVIATRDYMAGSSGYAGRLLNGQGTASASTPSSAGGTSADASGSGYITPQTANSAVAYGPLMLIGRPMVTLPSVCVIGDSIARGIIGGNALDPPDATTGAGGWVERSLGLSYPWTNLSSPGNLLGYMYGSYGRAGVLAAVAKAGCSAVLQELSINDLGGVIGTAAVSAAQVLAYEQQLVAELRGIPTVRQIIGVTTGPYTTGQTTQTPKSTSICTNIQARNADLRLGLLSTGKYSPSSTSDYRGLYDFVLDTDSVIEGATPCTWANTANTGDGLHPSSPGHALMAAFVAPILAADLQ